MMGESQETGIYSDLERHALDHAWNWFELHARHRMQSFNYFFVASAFLFAAYGTLLKEQPWASGATALIGAWVSFWFNRLERRTKQLVKAGEAALEPLQQKLAAATGVQTLSILQAVEDAQPGAAKYSLAIDCIEWGILTSFVGAALYAGFQATHFHLSFQPLTSAMKGVSNLGSEQVLWVQTVVFGITAFFLWKQLRALNKANESTAHSANLQSVLTYYKMLTDYPSIYRKIFPDDKELTDEQIRTKYLAFASLRVFDHWFIQHDHGSFPASKRNELWTIWERSAKDALDRSSFLRDTVRHHEFAYSKSLKALLKSGKAPVSSSESSGTE